MGTEHQCKITMFPAADGDCFLLEFNTGETEYRMMIDSGPVNFGDAKLKTVAEKLKADKKKIDLLLISHFDRDHIGGALSLLRDRHVWDVVGEIWHNGLQQIAPQLEEKPTADDIAAIAAVKRDYREAPPAKSGYISAEQSVTLSTLIARREIPVNLHAKGEAITSDTPMIPLGNDKSIEVFFLLPNKERLDALLKLFAKKLHRVIIGAKPAFTNDLEEAFYNYMCSIEPLVNSGKYISGKSNLRSSLEEYAYKMPEPDDSPTNAASIAVIIRYHGKKLLFAGDAVAEDLCNALKRWKEENNENLFFDVVKLPHHGSGCNCAALLDLPGFQGKHFLISTNGTHGHPNMETIARLIVRNTQETREISLNYPHKKLEHLIANSAEDTPDNYTLQIGETIVLFEVKPHG